MKATKLAEGVYWVGAIDWNLRDYHGYTLPGTTYNAYLITGEKNVLIDTTYPGFENQMLERIKDVIDPLKIDYVVANHVEMDHSGGLPKITKMLPGVPIYCTQLGVEGFGRHYDTKDWNFHVVKTGDTLPLGGGKTLVFVEAPMLHWPDSMFTYLAEDEILFPNDAFGQHIASSERFDDEFGVDEAMKHAQKFFANLIIPLAPKVLKKLAEVTDLKIGIKMVAPSHGVIWRKNAGGIIQAYADWSHGVSKDKVTIVYDTMHGSTTKMAQAIAEGVMEGGCQVKFCLLKDGRYEGVHRSDVVTDVLDSKAVIVGSSTLQDEYLPTVAGFMSYLRGLKPGRLTQKKKGFAFGSHGGHGGAVKLIDADLKTAGIEIFRDPIEVYYRPDESEIKLCHDAGKAIAEAVKTK